MGSMGSIGNIDARFQASTGDFTASLEGVQSSLQAVGARAKASGDAVAAGVGKMTASAEKARFAAMMADEATSKGTAAVEKNTTAHERAVRAWQREQLAQERSEAATQAVARAQELAALKADILARANEKLGLSANAVVAKFQLMGREISESMAGASEKVVAVAEKAELSADGIAAGFGGLGKLLGVGIAGEFVAHALDDVAELNVKMGDLHEKTGIAVQSLAGLRLIAQSKGLDFETISTGLIRLGKAMYAAKQGSQEDREAFQNLGISMNEVNTLSVEQMFYRVSKAISENRSLVISDGVALALFGRGGKEVVPMLREFGGNLEEVAKQQGALTGITDRSVAAGQKWRETTSDLSAELHSALMPVLVELVTHMGAIEAIIRGVDMVSVGVFGSLAELIASCTNVTIGFGKALWDVGHGHPMQGLHDYLGGYVNAANDWKGWWATLKADREAMMADWKESGNLPTHPEPKGENRPGDVDGALMKQARQELATLEQKHKLSHAQLVKFWQDQLKKAQPGSTDYEQVNLVLGNLAQHPGSDGQGKADREQMEKFQQGLADRKEAHELSVGEEYSYWQKMRDATAAGSKNYIAISREMGSLWQRVLKDQREVNDQYIKQPLLIEPKQFVGIDGKPAAAPKAPEQEFELSREDESRIKSQSSQQIAYLRSLKQGVDIREKASNQLAEYSIRMAVASGQMTRMDAAEAMAALHADQYRDALEKLQDSLANIQTMRGLTIEDRNEKASNIQNQIDQLAAARAQQTVEDQAGIDDSTLGGSIRQALDMYVQQAQDVAGQISRILTDAFNSVNSSLSHSLMEHAYNGREYRRNIENGLSETARGIGSQVLDSGFKQIEGSVLGRFGSGPKTKPDGSESNPIWVRLANGQLAGAGPAGTIAAKVASLGGGSLATSSIPLTVLIGGGDRDSSTPGSVTTTTPGQSGAGSLVSKIIGGALHFLPGFADGGSIQSNLPAIVGENGPEIFMPSSSGRIIPNDQLGGGGHHFHMPISVDARGATDPAAVEAAANRAVLAAAPHIVRAANSAMNERDRRTPASSRRS